MSHLPIVSVVIPCLNRSRFLETTLQSVLQQDYPRIECIVVDGGSTDGTIDILRRNQGRITWVSEPDNGHADAINKGWRMSKGEILAWLNADDVWVVPSAVSDAVSYLQDHPEVDVVYGDCGAIDADGRLIGMSHVRAWDLDYAVEFCDHCIPQPAAFMRRKIVERVGWLDIDFVSKKDHELWLRIGLAGTIQYIPVLLAHARSGPGYLARRGDITAQACVALTKKFFRLMGVPETLKTRRRSALANAYLRGMNYAWEDGRHWRVICAYALGATFTNPSNGTHALRRILGYVRASGALRPLRPLWRLVREATQWARGARSATAPNLLGDREIEWSWVAGHMPYGPGDALDFGSGDSHLALIAAERGFNVTAVDLQPIRWPYVHPRLRAIQGDIMKLPLPEGQVDLVINCSSVEHVGLAGRYGVSEARPDGDLEAMARLRDLLAPGGVMLLTIPAGHDRLFAPLCRIYGKERLPRLLGGFIVEKEAFWVKDGGNRWVSCDRETAVTFNSSAGSWNPLRNVYALACYVLRKPGDTRQ